MLGARVSVRRQNLAPQHLTLLYIPPVQATRTYLELTRPDHFRPAFDTFPDLVIERVERPTPELYRDCYRSVGEAYHWRDRWDWTDADIRAHLAKPEITLHVARRRGALAGWYELRRVPEDDSVEIAYFGLLPGAIGQGLGKHLLSCATHKLIIAAVLIVPVIVFALYTWMALTWTYSSGERAGYVQKFSKKGWICKTWEGELALVSIPGTMSEKFYFTVRDDSVAVRINQAMGKRVALTYQQHMGIPTSCFGETQYFVAGVKVVE